MLRHSSRQNPTHVRDFPRRSDEVYILRNFTSILWKLALKAGERAKDCAVKNPRPSKGKSAEQKDKYSQKCARAGNLSKAAATLYKSSLPACSVDTVDKLRMLHPEKLDYPKDSRPSLQQEAEFWEGEEGRNLLGDTFSIRNVCFLPFPWCP